MMRIEDALEAGAPPVVAILRGVPPTEVEAIAAALVSAGMRMIEVPLNSPDPFDSIARLVKGFGDEAAVGAGTVTTIQAVDRVADLGAPLLISPNTDAAVVARAVARGLQPMPGFVTPSEAYTAYNAGARRLKLFPAGLGGVAHLKAVREILPPDAEVWAVGGVDAATLPAWRAAGIAGIGVGGSVYRRGDGADVVGARAAALVRAWRDAC